MKKVAFKMLAAVLVIFSVCGLAACAPKSEEYKLTKMYAAVDGQKAEIEQGSGVFRVNKELFGETLKVSESSVEFSGSATRTLPGDFVKDGQKVKFNASSVDAVYSGKTEDGKFILIKGNEQAGYIFEYTKS